MNGSEKKTALTLLSGGLDSATVLYIARERGFRLYALSFEYGQRHAYEISRARLQAKNAGVEEHFIMRLDPTLFRGSALTEEKIPVPRDRTIDSEIPVTYVPARNMLFLAHAFALCESYEIEDVFIGVNALDYSGYPDCRPEFIAALEKAAALGMKSGVEGHPVKIHAPLQTLSKTRIIQEGLRLGVDYGATSSCYDPGPDGTPCGHCDSCVLRENGFREAGVLDPLTSAKITNES